ncbi:MAG: cell division protein FtsQ/DivIB [Acidobacteriota bacterium]
MKRSPSRPRMPYQDHLKYLRRRGNRLVRAQRRRRSVLRCVLFLLLWSGIAATGAAATAFGVRWITSPEHLQLRRVIVRGLEQARREEIVALVEPWLGRNVLEISLDKVEKKIREHPWVGPTGKVRIQRRLSDALVITIEERKAAGLALVDGFIVLLDEHGLPIDRFGPRYVRYDFPIIQGLDGLVRAAKAGDGVRLKKAMRRGVDVTRTLARKVPAFYAKVSQIDVSDPSMVVLRIDGRDYDLRLSRDEYLRNLEHYFALEKVLEGRGDAIDYVDLRWQDRVAVSPAATHGNQHGGR